MASSISYMSWDWKEAIELSHLQKALEPFGLKCLSVENGDAFEFMIYEPWATENELAQFLQVQYDNHEMSLDSAKSMFVYPPKGEE